MWGRILLDEIEALVLGSDEVAAWFLGGAGIAVKTAECIFYVDPYFGGSPSKEWLRMTAVPIDPREVRKATAVLSTHEHEDHCHRDSVVPIVRNTRAFFIGPRASAERARVWMMEEQLDTSRVVEVKPGDVVNLGDTILRVFESEDRNARTAVTYLIETPGGSLFHSGDSPYFPGLAAIGDSHEVDVAFLSIGRAGRGRRDYMTVCEAAKALEDLRAKAVVPIHYDLWKSTMEDPKLLELLIRAWGIKAKVIIMRLGDLLKLKRGHLSKSNRFLPAVRAVSDEG